MQPEKEEPRSQSQMNQPDLKALRINRLRDYMNMFGLSSTNSMGLDALVHTKEYQA